MWNDIFNDIFNDVFVAEATAPVSTIFNEIFGPIFNDIWAEAVTGTSWTSVLLTAPLVPADERVIGDPDLVPGDTVEYTNITGSGEFTLYSDGSYSYDTTVTGFTYRINDGTGVGSSATISFIVLPSVTNPFVDLIRTEGQLLQLEVDSNIQDATTITVTGIPSGSGLAYSNGILSGNLNSVDKANSPYTLTVTATNENGNTVDTFTVTTLVAEDYNGIRIDALYRPNVDAIVEPISGVSTVIYDSLGGTKLWEGAVDITDSGMIIDTTSYTNLGDSVFIITRWSESTNEFTYAGTETIIDLST